jgi:hypothetical protein
MHAQGLGAGARDDGRMLGQRPGDGTGPSRPRGPEGEPAHPDATAAHLAKDERPPAQSLAGDSGRFDFLDPPRSPGELGWLAHYRARRLLGEGGMGLVLEAEDTHLLRPVALKVIRPELSRSPQIARRFVLEARAMAALKHDHVVTIYQVGLHRGVPFLAMEYLRGMSLDRWLGRGHKPTVDLTLRLGREIAAGLDAAHRRGLIHRDIKPANIWLETPGGRVKILDFGLALRQGHDPHITSPGTTVGSPAYMAPEQARGERGDASCDLFSLGCVLYLLCTRELPFPGDSVMAVLSALANATPRAPRDRNPHIPEALDELIMRLLAKQAADRPPSARAVVESIKQIEGDLQAERQRAELPPATPVPAVEATAIYHPRGAVGGSGASEKARRRRRRLGIAAGGGGLGVMAVAPGVPGRPGRTVECRGWSPSPSRVPRLRSPARPRSRRSRSLRPVPQSRPPRRTRGATRCPAR